MSEATLHLKGRYEVVVKTALIKYLGALEALTKTEMSVGAATADTDELITMTKDLLNQLGYVPEAPRAKGSADVTRKEPLRSRSICFAASAAGPRAFWRTATT